MTLTEINKDIKFRFKHSYSKNKSALLKKLLYVFELPEGHYTHSVLNQYYSKYPEVFLNKELAKRILKAQIEQGGCFIVDYDEPFQGGYSRTTIETLNEDEKTNDSKISETINQNWRNFIEKSKSEYWGKLENIHRFNSLGTFSFYENRPPINEREKYLNSGHEVVINDVTKKIYYNFFSLRNVLKYYMVLINEFYPDFQLIEEISTDDIKRFGKDLGNGNYLGLYFDFGFLTKELKKTYVELPKIKIELFSENLKSSVKEDIYLRDQGEFPIARINYTYFIGNPTDSRIGNSSNDENHLKRDLFYFFDIYSYYLTTYLGVIEMCLEEVLNQKK